MKLLLFFIVIPLIELYVLIQVGSEVGALSVVLWTVLGALLGIVLMRNQGLSTMQEAQTAMHKHEPIQSAMMQGVFVFLGGMLLFLPGLITDALGILLLIPFVRRYLVAQSVKGMAQKGSFQYTSHSENVFEGDWQEKPTEETKVLEGEVVKPAKDRNQDV